jgi:hypothetical protein
LERFEESIAIYEKAVRFSEKNLGEENGMTEKLRGVLANAMECKSNKKVDRDRVRQMSRERMERPDKVGKLRGVYNDRPTTAASKHVSRH